MKKCLRIILCSLCLLGLLAGCGNQGNVSDVEISKESTIESTVDTSVDTSTTESTEETTTESTTESVPDDVVEDTTQSTTEESTESSSEDVTAQFDMKKMNLSGLYYGVHDSVGVIITDDGKIMVWDFYNAPENKERIYDIISVEIATYLLANDALFDTTYKITGRSSDGEEYIACTDGRLLYGGVYYMEEIDFYMYEVAAEHVRDYDEYIMSEMPSTCVVPTFDEVVTGAELDADVLSEVCGLYYSPSIESGSDTHECAFVITEDGYLYEWDNVGEISSDDKWQKSAIVRVYVPEEGDPNSIIIDTRYHSYTFDPNGDKANLNLLYNVMQYYTATCYKVDELPSSVPALD